MILALVAALSVALASDSRTVSDVYRPGESATWVFETDGIRIGHHVMRYLGRDDLAGVRAHHFEGAFELLSPFRGGVDVRSTAELWTDDFGHPVRFVQQKLVSGVYSRVELLVAGKESKAHVVQGPSSRDAVVAVDPSAYLLANNFVSHVELLAALLPSKDGASVKMFSGNTLQGFSYTLTPAGEFEDEIDGRKVKGDAYDDSLGEHLRFVDGRLLDIEIAGAKSASKLVIRRSNETFDPIVVVPPETQEPAGDFDREDVMIAHDDARIAGTITKKKGATGRLPAVFFISGSGPQDRNGYSNGIDLGTHEILDHLTALGFLVLRVDDRGTGESSPLPADASYLDLVADASACVDFLLQRPDVDPKRVALIGHSEGAETAALLAVERKETMAIVLLAPAGRSIFEVLADQNRLELERSGLAKDEIEKQMKELHAFFVKLAGDEEIEATTDGERIALANRKWFRSHARIDPIATIRQVTCPVLVLQGATDFQVSPEKDAAAIDAALEAAHHPDHELHVLPGLDHLFARTPGERSEIADYGKKRPIDPQLFAVLDPFLIKRL